MKTTIDYCSKWQRLLQMATTVYERENCSDDNQVRFIARESLQLHMNKRKVNLAKSDDPSFGGYEVNEAGIIKKNSKQFLSKSQWVELNELCARTRIRLLKTNDEFKIVLPGTSQPLQCSNYYKPLYEHLHQKQLSEWMELEFQGAIIRQEAFDMQCSQEIHKNNSLADKLVKFVTKARLQIAETNETNDETNEFFFLRTNPDILNICILLKNFANHYECTFLKLPKRHIYNTVFVLNVLKQRASAFFSTHTIAVL